MLHGWPTRFSSAPPRHPHQWRRPTDIRASAQGLYVAVASGLGLFAGTQFTGFVMDYFRSDGKFRWRPIFLMPACF